VERRGSVFGHAHVEPPVPQVLPQGVPQGFLVVHHQGADGFGWIRAFGHRFTSPAAAPGPLGLR
jgi:hypothetical protein